MTQKIPFYLAHWSSLESTLQLSNIMVNVQRKKYKAVECQIMQGSAGQLKLIKVKWKYKAGEGSTNQEKAVQSKRRKYKAGKSSRIA